MKASSLFSRLRAVAAKSPFTPVCRVSTKSAGAFFVLAFALLAAGISTPTASAQAVTYAGSGAVNFGGANVCPSGTSAPAPCSETLTLTYNVTESGNLGTPQALVTGVPNLDYKIASGTTCTGSVSQGTTCKVNVTFAPTAPGQRKGAVEILDASNKVLATTYIYGNGLAPLVGYVPASGATRDIGPFTTTYLFQVIADAAGNAFVLTNPPNGLEIEEMFAVDGTLPPNPVLKILGKYAIGPIAIDGAGNIFSQSSNEVIEIIAAGDYSSEVAVGNGYRQISGIALDGSGNLFVSDQGNPPAILPSVKEFLAADGYKTSKTLGNGYTFASPNNLALDGGGNVYVTEANIIEEVVATGDYTTVRVISPPSSSYSPGTMVLDPAGDLFVLTSVNFGQLIELQAVDGVVPQHPTAIIVAPGSGEYFPIALEPNGNLLTILQDCIYNCDLSDAQGVRPNDYTQGWRVIEPQLTIPAALTFPSTIVDSTSAPQTLTIQDRGTADLDFTALSVIGPNWTQVHGDGTSPDCAISSPLVSGALCNFSIGFQPTELGPLTSTFSVVDNTFNVPGSSQSNSLSGTGVAALPHITSLSNYYGAPYSVVILHGTGFGAIQGSSTVTFNGVPTPHYHWSDTEIYVTVPPNATIGGGDLVVTVKGDTSSESFTVVPQPTVTRISPTSGPDGTIVNIEGHNLLDLQGKQTVTLNGQSLPIVGASSTALMVAIPASYPDGSYHFHVLTNDTGINTPTFTVAPPTNAITGPPATSFGSANVCPVGKTAPAPCSQTLTLTYTAAVASTLGVPRVLTTGQPNLDYQAASGGTCTGSLGAGDSCTVKVTFAPIAPGARNGAVEIVDGSGSVLATTYISGTGVGSLVSFGPPVPRAFNAGAFNSIGGVAVDASGNIFIADATYSFTAPFGSIRELLAVDGVVPSNPVVKYLPIGDGHAPVSIAIDGEGNLFFADYVGFANTGTNNIVEVMAADGYSTSRIILTGLGARPTVAVDGSGNVFAADQIGPTATVPSVREALAEGNYTTVKTLGGGFNFNNISGMAVDSAGNLFVCEYSQSNPDLSAIEEILATGGYTTVRTISNPLLSDGYAVSVAVDPAGNLFASIYGPTNELFVGEFLAVNGVVPPNPAYIVFDNGIDGISFDQHGNLYGGLPGSMNNLAFQELQFDSMPPLAFGSATVGSTSVDSPQSIQIQNQGNSKLDVTGVATSPSWYQDSGASPLCSASFSLAAGAVCNLSISFKPTEVGPLTGAVTLTDNNLNLPGSTQSGTLSGTGILGPPPPQITAISATYAAAFSSITLIGSNFGATEGSSTVAFSGVGGHPSAWSDTKIVVMVPKVRTYGPGDLLVTVAEEPSNAVAFAVEPQPGINSLIPARGPVGTLVEINGSNLKDAGNHGVVTLNGKSLPFTYDTLHGSLIVTIPTGAVTGAFTVLVNNATLTSPTFTLTP